MKYLFLSIVLLISSCASVKYEPANNKNSFDRVHKGQTYVVFAGNNRNRLTVNSIEKDSIRFTDKANKEVVLEKNSIKKIRKNNTGGTVVLAYFGAAALLVMIGIYIFANAPRTK